MTDRWVEFLESRGLTSDPDGYTRVSSENIDSFQKLTGDMLCDLSHLTLVRATGIDAQVFLQNQLTNDLSSLDPNQTVLAGYCNPKGRLVCIFRLWQDEQGFILQLASDLADASIDRLRKFVLRAKVDLSIDETLTGLGVCGKTAAKGLEQLVGELPRRENASIRFGDSVVTRLPGDDRPRFQIVGPVRSCIGVWAKLEPRATVVGSWTWSRLDILAGLPNITSRISETFVPQMVNLDVVGGVNFKKGCYPGQEIVARMHYLGNLKQRMARFHVDDDRRPLPGDRIYTKGQAPPTGTIVDAQPDTGTGWDMLAVVRIADMQDQTLCLRNETGPLLFQQDLPYTVIEPDQQTV